jgi:hypothetical protein
VVVAVTHEEVHPEAPGHAREWNERRDGHSGDQQGGDHYS